MTILSSLILDFISLDVDITHLFRYEIVSLTILKGDGSVVHEHREMVLSCMKTEPIFWGGSFTSCINFLQDVSVAASEASASMEMAKAEPPRTNGTASDMYSDNALEELEALGGADEDTSILDTSAITHTTEPDEAGASAAVVTEKPSKEKLSQAEAMESRDTFEEKPMASAEEKAARRRSWHEKSDRRATVDESPATKQDVKLRKAASMDVTRPASLKKLRTGETRPSKTTPSPIKATYRPMSMPIDNLVASMEEDLDKKSQEGDNNSGTER